MATAGLLGLLMMIVFFGPTDNWSWDPSFYYAQIRSPIIDHDLDFRNETKTGSIELGYTATGLQPSLWPIGPSLLWSPFFLVAHGLTLVINPAEANGFYFPYIALVSFGSMLYGLAGLYIIYRLCRFFSGIRESLLVTALCLGATPLFFYMFRQPIMAHTTGLFAVAALVFSYVKLSAEVRLSAYSGLLFGVLLALCFLTRWNGLLMGVVPLFYFGEHLISGLRRRATREAWAVLRQVCVMLGAFLLTMTPQLALLYRLHGTLFALPQSGDAFVDSLLPINLPSIFFHTNRGLVFWCPFALLGMASIIFIPDVRLRLMAALVSVGQIILIGYRVDWYSGGGFGARYFIELLPFFAIGTASLLQRLPHGRVWSGALFAGSALLILHQSVLVFAVEHGTEGWVDLGRYVQGQPLGGWWQLDTFLALLSRPSLLFAPRPYVAVDRQTILVSLYGGIRDQSAYYITGTTLFLTPIVALLIPSPGRSRWDRAEIFLLLITVSYFTMWSALILFIGHP